MDLFVVPRLPSIPIHLVFLLLTTCCAFLFPCSLCIESQYDYCSTTGSTCGDKTFIYPVGVGNRGCGHPTFQIDCVENSTPGITILGQNYTILNIYPNNNSFLIVRSQNCYFLNDSDISSELDDTTFRITSTYDIMNLYVYKCSTLFSQELYYIEQRGLKKCNATVYYGLYNIGLPIMGCEQEQVPDYGGMMEWVYNDENRDKSCRSCETSGGICGYNISVSSKTAPFLCYCKDGSSAEEKCSSHGKKTVNGAAIGCSVAAVLIAAGLVAGIIVYRRRKSDCCRESLVVRNLTDDDQDKDMEARISDKDMESGIQGKIGTMPIFSYEILKRATNDFDEKNQLGDGGFGSVYLGKLPDGRSVAVKRLYQDNSKRVEQFINEVQILSSFCHPNLVSLYGCTSPESRDLLLVYEYIPNGTLADHLHGERKKDKGLSWDTRLKICIETAQALEFLHNLEPPIYHRDVKSTNILLDEHFKVKVADFGLSRFVPLNATHVSTAPQGTPGYIDPEYHQCFQLTDKSDVYSFGVVLMEIISAKVAVDVNRTRREIVLATMAIAKVQAGSLHELVDSNLDIDRNPHIRVMVSAAAELAFRCLAPEKEDRPNMKEVVAELEQIKQNGGKFKDPTFHPPSPTSVQEKWPSTKTTPENSVSSV